MHSPAALLHKPSDDRRPALNCTDEHVHLKSCNIIIVGTASLEFTSVTSTVVSMNSEKFWKGDLIFFAVKKDGDSLDYSTQDHKVRKENVVSNAFKPRFRTEFGNQ